MTTIPFPTPNPSSYPPRPRGAPKGNQNARRKGLYDKQEDLWSAFLAARDAKGCADEIAILRIRIKLMFTRHAPNEELLHACEVLNRLLLTHHRLMHPQGDPEYDN